MTYIFVGILIKRRFIRDHEVPVELWNQKGSTINLYDSFSDCMWILRDKFSKQIDLSPHFLVESGWKIVLFLQIDYLIILMMNLDEFVKIFKPFEDYERIFRFNLFHELSTLFRFLECLNIVNLDLAAFDPKQLWKILTLQQIQDFLSF